MRRRKCKNSWVTVARQTGANDLAVEGAQRRKQRGRAVTLVVVVWVRSRPWRNGSPGCMRYSAWIWLFSSTHNTNARWMRLQAFGQKASLHPCITLPAAARDSCDRDVLMPLARQQHNNPGAGWRAGRVWLWLHFTSSTRCASVVDGPAPLPESPDQKIDLRSRTPLGFAIPHRRRELPLMEFILLPIFFCMLFLSIPGAHLAAEVFRENRNESDARSSLCFAVFVVFLLTFVAPHALFYGRSVNRWMLVAGLTLLNLGLAVVGFILRSIYRKKRVNSYRIFAASAFICAALFPIAWFTVSAPLTRALSIRPIE